MLHLVQCPSTHIYVLEANVKFRYKQLSCACAYNIHPFKLTHTEAIIRVQRKMLQVTARVIKTTLIFWKYVLRKMLYLTAPSKR